MLGLPRSMSMNERLAYVSFDRVPSPTGAAIHIRAVEERFSDFAGIWIAVRKKAVRTFAFRTHNGTGKLN